MEKLVLLLALSATALACDITWPNGTDTTFHWFQCNSGPVMFYNATPFDQTGKNYEYPIHLGAPIMVKCDVLNPTHVYSSPNLRLTVNIWSWGTSLGGCAWSAVPTFGLLMVYSVFVLLAIVGTVTSSCQTWPNGTDTKFHWWQCSSGPVKYYSAEPYDET
ncbi:hypothetical protein NECAME_16772, partial [Necator americanus]